MKCRTGRGRGRGGQYRPKEGWGVERGMGRLDWAREGARTWAAVRRVTHIDRWRDGCIYGARLGGRIAGQGRGEI